MNLSRKCDHLLENVFQKKLFKMNPKKAMY